MPVNSARGFPSTFNLRVTRKCANNHLCLWGEKEEVKAFKPWPGTTERSQGPADVSGLQSEIHLPPEIATTAFRPPIIPWPSTCKLVYIIKLTACERKNLRSLQPGRPWAGQHRWEDECGWGGVAPPELRRHILNCGTRTQDSSTWGGPSPAKGVLW